MHIGPIPQEELQAPDSLGQRCTVFMAYQQGKYRDSTVILTIRIFLVLGHALHVFLAKRVFRFFFIE
jgi:hypothetical protein